MPRLVSVPAGEIGPLSCVMIAELDLIGGLCAARRERVSMVLARAKPRIVVPSCLKSLDVMRDASACPELNIRQRRGLNLVTRRRSDGWPHTRSRARASRRSSARGRARARSGGLQAVRGSSRFLSTSRIDWPVSLELAQHLPDFLRMIGASPSVASSRISSSGLVISARAIASICCSPPDNWPPICVCARAIQGNSSTIASVVQRGLPAGSGCRGGGEVLPHREAGEDAAPLRHQAEAELGDAERGQPAQLPPFEGDRAAMRRGHSHDGADGRGLAHAVAAEQRHHLAAVDFEVDLEQHLALAVARLQVPQP